MNERGFLAGVVLDSTDPQRLARFWADVLGYVVVEDSPGWVELEDPDGGWPHLTCQGINQHVQHGSTTSTGNRFHLDLGVAPQGPPMTTERITAEVARLQRLGARKVERVRQPEGDSVHWVWTDPEGNVFCGPGL
jgi:catechol 2,3-dioxygenase-like lactoylglutathione lyase family enzyme